MGNFTSCFGSSLQFARLIDVHGNLRHVKVPVTAAEVMLLEQPGHLVSSVADDLRSGFRLSALRADEVLANGKLYFLIHVGRLNSFVTESELEMLRSRCGNEVKRRRGSKVLPEENCSGSVDEVGDGTVEVHAGTPIGKEGHLRFSTGWTQEH
ncbi:hypothetical protein L1987_21770 [Smallanthus sonchifolius]|uniref:Uncharacterized protein n=1 Tax=Smallanthus sonchifolius TaxID=185202 RepID=A0ACB9ICC4_9ASTR|nr:hypothetical protein L1987_21770 [Smallanthus sonchifolius]